MPLDPDLARRSFCHLETIGRRTGRPRVVEMWFAADPGRDRIFMLSGGRDGSHWVRNLQRQPAVRVTIAGRTLAGRASVIEGGPDDGLARRLLAAKYQGWQESRPLSGWARTALPVAIDVELSGSARPRPGRSIRA